MTFLAVLGVIVLAIFAGCLAGFLRILRDFDDFAGAFDAAVVFGGATLVAGLALVLL